KGGGETSFSPPHDINTNMDTTAKRDLTAPDILEKLIIKVRSPRSKELFKYSIAFIFKRI
ncbi:MAG: hypothetical protein MK011_10910, partial [Dehalococcoidia bacterium]|nr:hypothetical protein [Dehalococcoidia bacterium]